MAKWTNGRIESRNPLKRWLWRHPRMFAWNREGTDITGPMLSPGAGIVRLALARWVLR